MQHIPGRRALALVAALAFATAGSAFAQDTTDVGGAPIDTSQPAAGALDTAGVDTSAVRDTTDTSAVRDTTDTSAVRDTTDTSGVQNPPGYRGMERDTTMVPPTRGGADSAAHDSVPHGGAEVGDTGMATPDSTP
jgi:hypothetical protein